jgi:hypothetical protein
LILTFGAPFFIVFFTFRNIRAIIQDLVNPILAVSDTTTGDNSDFAVIHDIMERLSMVLDSPMQGIVATMQRTDNNNNNEKVNDQEMQCEMKSLSCKNDELMDVLP